MRKLLALLSVASAACSFEAPAAGDSLAGALGQECGWSESDLLVPEGAIGSDCTMLRVAGDRRLGPRGVPTCEAEALPRCVVTRDPSTVAMYYQVEYGVSADQENVSVHSTASACDARCPL